MNSETHTPTQPAYFGIAIRLAGFLLAGFLIVILLIGPERRGALESVERKTSVGDIAYYTQLSSPDAPAILSGGKPLYLSNPKSAKRRESEMLIAGTDDSGKYTLYRHGNQGTELYLKAEPGRFLKLQAR